MFSQQSNKMFNNVNNVNNIDNIKCNPFLENLNLYIPRALLTTTEQQVKDVFFRNQIGTVEYCDIVVIKDKETKQPLHCQVFLKLECWNMLSKACFDFAKNGSIKYFLGRDRTEFWMILPNKNPLPRTHVNTSQLAASTEKLFEQAEKINEKASKFEDEMRAEMAEMRLFMKLQQSKIEALEFKLSETENELTAKISDLTDKLSLYKEKESQEDKEEDIYELLKNDPLPVLKRCDASSYPYRLQDKYDDEVDELLKYVDQVNTSPKISRKNSVSYNEEDNCIFSTKHVERKTSPIAVFKGTPTKPISLTEIVTKNPEKAIASRDFCGNF